MGQFGAKMDKFGTKMGKFGAKIANLGLKWANLWLKWANMVVLEQHTTIMRVSLELMSFRLSSYLEAPKRLSRSSSPDLTRGAFGPLLLLTKTIYTVSQP